MGAGHNLLKLMGPYSSSGTIFSPQNYIETKRGREKLNFKEKSTEKVFDVKLSLKFQSSDQEKMQSELTLLKSRALESSRHCCWQHREPERTWVFYEFHEPIDRQALTLTLPPDFL